MSEITFILLLSYVWFVLVFGTTAYAVFWLGHSGWWFLLALVVAQFGCVTIKTPHGWGS